VFLGPNLDLAKKRCFLIIRHLGLSLCQDVSDSFIQSRAAPALRLHGATHHRVSISIHRQLHTKKKVLYRSDEAAIERTDGVEAHKHAHTYDMHGLDKTEHFQPFHQERLLRVVNYLDNLLAPERYRRCLESAHVQDRGNPKYPIF